MRQRGSDMCSSCDRKDNAPVECIECDWNGLFGDLEHYEPLGMYLCPACNSSSVAEIPTF